MDSIGYAGEVIDFEVIGGPHPLIMAKASDSYSPLPTRLSARQVRLRGYGRDPEEAAIDLLRAWRYVEIARGGGA
jgi:hypothetical protein